jgi:hypothetical protein
MENLDVTRGSRMTISKDITRFGISRRAAVERARVALGLEITLQGLATHANRGTGAPYRNIGGVCYYPVDTFDAWCRRRISPVICRAADARLPRDASASDEIPLPSVGQLVDGAPISVAA